MRVKIRLDTLNDVNHLVEIASRVSEQITLEDGNGMCVSAKSLLGSIYAMEFANIYCCCDRDITAHIMDLMI